MSARLGTSGRTKVRDATTYPNGLSAASAFMGGSIRESTGRAGFLLASSSDSLGPLQSFFRCRIRFCTHVSVYGLRFSLLLRIGWVCVIIAVFEDDYLHPLTAELFCLRAIGHVNVEVLAVHFPTSVFHGIVAGIPSSAINADAGV